MPKQERELAPRDCPNRVWKAKGSQEYSRFVLEGATPICYKLKGVVCWPTDPKPINCPLSK